MGSTSQEKSKIPKRSDSSFTEAAKSTLGLPDELPSALGIIDTSDDVEPASQSRSAYDYTPSEAKSLPDWVVLPTDLTFPKGRTIGYMRFRSQWTDVPEKGDRQCIVWNLTVMDERLAIKRARGEATRVLSELAKQMIRAIDGVKSDWTGKLGTGSVDKFWDELGTRCREQIQNYYVKTHSLSSEEQDDFFANCIDIRTAT